MKNLFKFFSRTTRAVFFRKKRRRLSDNSFDFHNFEKVISISTLHSTGQVHLISLEYIKEELGLRWLTKREDIFESLDRKIRQKISDEDVYFSRSDTEHLIVFSKMFETTAQQLCGDILKELSIMYLGSSYDHNITIRTAIGHRNGKLLFKDIAYSSPADKEIIETSNSRIITSPKLEPFVSPIRPHKKRPFELIYKPIWDKKNNIVSTFMVSIRKISKTNSAATRTSPIGYHALNNPFCLASMIELDQFMLDEIIAMMNDFFKNNFRAMFSIPLNYKTLFNLTRLHNFLESCQSIPVPLRKYINFTLADFPEGFPEARMHEIITSLLKFCRDVTIVCDKIPQDISYFKGCGVKGICLNITEKEKHSKEYLLKIQKLADDCAAENINLSLDGIDDFEELEIIKETELSFISGDTIGRYSDAPRHMVHKNWNDIVKH